MAIVYSPNIIEIAVNHTLQSKACVNVWHMWFDSELGSDTKTAVVEDFRNNWQDHMLDLVAADLELVNFEWRSLDPNDASLGVVEPDPAKALVGQNGGSSFPPNVAVLIKKNTEDRPRGARDGRSFLGGAPLPQAFEDGTWNTTYVTAANTSLLAFYNGISDTSGAASGDRYPAVLETSAESRAPGTAPVTIPSRRITSITLDPLVSTQRDRLR